MVEKSDQVKGGLAFLPLHWGARFLGRSAAHGVNELTPPAIDPDSRQPELKHCAVGVERANLPWRLVAFCRGANTVAALKAQLACGTSCGSCVPELHAMIASRKAAA